jgi:hypothetical protein
MSFSLTQALLQHAIAKLSLFHRRENHEASVTCGIPARPNPELSATGREFRSCSVKEQSRRTVRLFGPR